MHRVNERITFDLLIGEAKKTLPRVFPQKDLRSFFSSYADGDLSNYLKNKVYKETTLLPLEWNKETEFKLFTFEDANQIQPEEVLSSFNKSFYFSHQAAMYFNELTDQQPKSYYFSKEYENRTPAINDREISPFKIKQVFTGSHRNTERFCRYKDTKFIFLYKQNLEEIGVISKQYERYNSPGVTYRLTNVERTLLDSIISPHYSGGIQNVLISFNKKTLNLDEMYKVYQKYSPTYPFWQTIGFAIRNYIGDKPAQAWKDMFNTQMIPFYVDRKYRSTWAFDSEWQVYHPKGLK